MPRSRRSRNSHSSGDDDDDDCRTSSHRDRREPNRRRQSDTNPKLSRSRSRSRHRSPLSRRERKRRPSGRSRSHSRRRCSYERRRRHGSDHNSRRRERERRYRDTSSRSPSPEHREKNGQGSSRHHRHRPHDNRPSESSGQPSSSLTGSGTSGPSKSPTPLRQVVATNGFNPSQDGDGHLIYHPCDFVGRYEIGRDLGEGTFGKVVSCIDHEEQRQVAVKIIKNIDRYRAAAKIEIDILKDIYDEDTANKSYCIRLLDSFEFHGHVCLVFERLGLSLYDVLDKNGHHGYPMQQIRHISHQVASGLKFLHRLGLTHTDLKPENILFVNSDADQQYNLHVKKTISIVRDAQIKLIDFGSATYDEDHHGRIVATRHYRPIEIILELGWSNVLDMWSLGCIMYELYTGVTLFQTHSNREHMAMMEEYIGHIPTSMVKRSPCRRRYFHSDATLDWDKRGRAHRYIRDHSRPLKSFKYLDDGDPDVEDLFDLIPRLLTYEPKDRYTASQSLRHRFFDMYNN